MDDEILRQIMRNIRATACNTVQHLAARSGGTLDGAALDWAQRFIAIADIADEALAEHDRQAGSPDSIAISERGFGQ